MNRAPSAMPPDRGRLSLIAALPWALPGVMAGLTKRAGCAASSKPTCALAWREDTPQDAPEAGR